MQLLEEISIGETIVEEGLFTSKLDEKEYKHFEELCKFVVSIVKIPKDSGAREYQLNEKALDKLSSRPSTVRIYARQGKWNKVKLIHTAKAAKDNYVSFNVPTADQMISKMRTAYKLKTKGYWEVVTYNGLEQTRSLELYGPLSDSSWVKMTISVGNYKNKYDEIYSVKFSVRPIKESDKKKYDKGK